MNTWRTFRAANGNTLTAIDETQASAMIRGGMVEITNEEKNVKNNESTANTRQARSKG